ncbi:zinc-binding alcohol dehydrogenase family protein [Actinoallomurus purpureus]|uniref:quinone oxidoreductase family protein n=1 Tax=Actinoallomurus purpureus TaxID=478114 RepID=UPI002092DD63|nr:zinc-binding alcohol dehydrogenase family protein [Actinoallomurus purpureus]MCO6008887.1 zinc-binding alcohol dehydrogenase family protein [Actinoallomurus purpureus]
MGRTTHAAVVRSFDAPPRHEAIPLPEPSGEHDVVVDVLAAGLHPRVRSTADGSHYTSEGVLPLVPGIDGVGRTPEGDLLYFVLPDTAFGSMAEQTVIDRRRAFALPAGTDPIAVAAAMNPGMSSWVALHRRIDLQPGQDVLVLGATGNAGQLAVQIARHLGAGRVIGAGRDAERLKLVTGLGADEVVSLDGEDADIAHRISTAAADVDVVIDYLWGHPAEQAMLALAKARTDRAKPLTWIQIGSVAGADISLPSSLLRAANLQIMGSGQGSVTTAAILAELPALAAQISSGTLTVDPLPMPLAQVEQAWTTPTIPGQRLVLTT